MLEIALCLQLSAGVIECRKDVQGPYVASMACRERMMQGEENPLNLVFVVDVHVQRIDGEPKGTLLSKFTKATSATTNSLVRLIHKAGISLRQSGAFG